MITKNKILNLFVPFLFLLLFSCGNDDENPLYEEDKIQTDAKKEDLAGVWSIYKVESNGNEANVPVNNQQCGRDFFMYYDNGFYEEFLFQESTECLPTKNKLEWTLNNGIITISSITTGDSEIIKIKNLTKNSFVFITNLDLDGNGVKEKYTFTALKYLPPNEIDIYSVSFQRKDETPFENHLEFGWNIYKGYNNFEKYEIYRSDNTCNINTATLIKTITNIDNNTFIDENPPNGKEFCYFFKIYTNKGLLGESDLRYVNTEYLYPKNVVFNNYEVVNNSINLSWEKYSGYYFSHYEIRVQDQNQNSSPNIETVKIITDVNSTSFLDENPPYINNPIYTIYAHNIFGNISNLNDNGSMIETSFIRPEILDLTSVKFINFDAKNQSIFIFGRAENGVSRLLKYNYITNKISAEAFKLPTTYNEVEMRLVDSGNGNELLFPQAGDLWVYDAETLNFKYSIKEAISPDSFHFLDNDIWVLSNSDYVFTYKREQDKFIKIDKKSHFTDHQGSMNYEITKIDKNNILLSHNNEGRAIHYSINDNGQIINNGIKEIPLKLDINSSISVTNNLILNKLRNTIYDANNFSLIDTYSIPKTTLNFNTSGTEIYGTNNIVNIIDPNKSSKKELVIYNLQDKTTKTLITKGYPNFVAEDDFGNIVSLSTSFIHESANGFPIYNTKGIFVEIVK